MTSIPAIQNPEFALAVARSRGTAPSGGPSRFVVADPAAGETAATTRALPPTGLQRVLLSPEDEQEVRDDQGRRRARRLLAGLASLQLGLLAGDPSEDGRLRMSLTGLRDELRDMPTPLHPELAGVLAAIALRVEVELARRTVG